MALGVRGQVGDCDNVEVRQVAKLMKRRIFAGSTCEQQVYSIPDGVRNVGNYDPEKVKKDRFESAAAYERHKEGISRRNHARLFNENFSPSSIYSTHTFDNEWEIHDFDEARIVRRRFVRALKRKYPDAVIFLYMGRGKATNRIHFHMVSDGIPEEAINAAWKYGRIRHVSYLREHNWYEGVDHGRDYTGLANYLFDHWTPEVGGHRWFATKNARKPEKEEPTEVKVGGGYSTKRPPKAPKGYILVSIEATKYGYWCFKYVVDPRPQKTARRSG